MSNIGWDAYVAYQIPTLADAHFQGGEDADEIMEGYCGAWLFNRPWKLEKRLVA